jgi:hypothetical protein
LVSECRGTRPQESPEPFVVAVCRAKEAQSIA